MGSENNISKIMRKEVVSVNGNKTIHKCAQLMKEKKIGSLIITDNKKKIVGIITEQDLARKVLASSINPKKSRIKEVMSKKLYVIKPNASLNEVITLMSKKEIEHLPVVQGDKIKGIISEKDIIKKHMLKNTFSFHGKKFLS